MMMYGNRLEKTSFTMMKKCAPRDLARELADLLLPELRDELARDVLDVKAVMSRYGLSDPRTARDAMHTAGGTFTVARRLLIHRATLEAWERSRIGEEPPDASSTMVDTPQRRPGGLPRALPSDFWRAGQ